MYRRIFIKVSQSIKKVTLRHNIKNNDFNIKKESISKNIKEIIIYTENKYDHDKVYKLLSIIINIKGKYQMYWKKVSPQ